MQYSAKGILRFFFFHFSTRFTTFKTKTPLLLFFCTYKQDTAKNMSIRLCVLAVIECSWAGNIAFAIMVFVY